MSRFGITLNVLILCGVFAGLIYYRAQSNYQRWQNSPASVHKLLPKEPRFVFRQLQGGQGRSAPPVHEVKIEADSDEARLIVQTFENLQITPLSALDSTLKPVGEITLSHHLDTARSPTLPFHAIEILAWPTGELLPADAPPLFKLEVVNDHWGIVTIAGRTILQGRLSAPISEPLASLHRKDVEYLESRD